MPAGAKPRTRLAAHLKMVQHPQVAAAPRGNVTALEMQRADHVGDHFVIGIEVAGGSDKPHVTARPREILLNSVMMPCVGLLLLSSALYVSV